MTTVTGTSFGRHFSITSSSPYAEMTIETTDGSLTLAMDDDDLTILRDTIEEFLKIKQGDMPDQAAKLLERFGTMDVKQLQDFWKKADENSF